MTSFWKVVVPIGIVFVLVIIFGSQYWGNKSQEEEQEAGSPSSSEPAQDHGRAGGSAQTAPSANGSVGAMLQSLAGDASAEQARMSEEFKDADQVSVDGQAIRDLGQSYAENEF